MKARSSTRATSAGFDRTRTLLGRFAGLTGMAVPASVINCIIPWYSACEPLHQCTPSGLHIRATSSTQLTSCRLTVDSASIVCVRLAMKTSPYNRGLSYFSEEINSQIRSSRLPATLSLALTLRYGEESRRQSANTSRVPDLPQTQAPSSDNDRQFQQPEDR